MKSKIKSLLFWAAFFFLLISIMFCGVFFLIKTETLFYVMGKVVDISVYIFIAIYIIFSILIILNKFPEKIKRFEKFKYLALMFLLILIEIIVLVYFLLVKDY